jgi:hypothetical protein
VREGKKKLWDEKRARGKQVPIVPIACGYLSADREEKRREEKRSCLV